MFLDLVDKVKKAYGGFSPDALNDEWQRRLEASDFTIDGLNYGKAMLQKAFETVKGIPICE